MTDLNPARSGSLERLFTIYVGVGLLVISLFAGLITYTLAFREVIASFDRMQAQLVRTVQSQAEVAVFADNDMIGQSVIDGLLATPQIRGVRIVGHEQFQITGGEATKAEFAQGRSFPLYSPVEAAWRIGEIILVRNETAMRVEAREQALRQTALLLLQVVLATALLFGVTRHLVSKPVVDLAEQMADYTPGVRKTISTTALHANDELGLMAHRASQLIDSAETALAEVRALATTDPLTGLPNRRHFNERLHDEFGRMQRYEGPPASLVMFDLDHFKQVNDRYGHAGGDLLLCEFARRMRQDIRKVDTPGRLGGEEFAILMPGTRPEEAAAFAERLRRALEGTTLESDKGPIRATVSIGISVLGKEDETPECALNRADQALYRAKEAGRNRIEIDHQGC